MSSMRPRTRTTCSCGRISTRRSANTGGEDVEAMYPLLAEIEPDDWEDLSHYDHKP
jgi:hypothetical protein